MPKIFDKLRGLMFDEYDGDEEYYEEEDYTEEEMEQTQTTPLKKESERYSNKTSSNNRKNSNVYHINTNTKMQLVILQPVCYEDAQKITDHIKEGKPVVINLEQVQYQVAQRIMDFLSGTCYSLEGSIQKVANGIFVIAPQNIEVSGEWNEKIKEVLPWASNA